MALLDVLQERTGRRCRTAQVDCGELGLLTVEALPPAELARLQTDRAVLYAACRELQSAGENLRRAGKLFAPDEITAYLSDEEAASGAAAVRDISGGAASRQDAGTGTDAVSGAENESASRTENGEIRLDTVQMETADGPRVSGDDGQNQKPFGDAAVSTGLFARTEDREIRLGAVQDSGTETTKVRHDSVQKLGPTDRDDPLPLPQNQGGQDSREFCPEPSHGRKTDKKSQGIVDLPGWNTRNLGVTGSAPSRGNPEAGTAKAPRFPHETTSEIPDEMHETASESGHSGAGAVHETTSDFPEKLHEIKSEPGDFGSVFPHEIKSELRETLHETTSEFPAQTPGRLHEIGSEIPEELHETTSGSGAPAQKRVHEIRSEVREAVHEMESELTDRVARSILEGLRRAAAVR